MAKSCPELTTADALFCAVCGIKLDEHQQQQSALGLPCKHALCRRCIDLIQSASSTADSMACTRCSTDVLLTQQPAHPPVNPVPYLHPPPGLGGSRTDLYSAGGNGWHDLLLRSSSSVGSVAINNGGNNAGTYSASRAGPLHIDSLSNVIVTSSSRGWDSIENANVKVSSVNSSNVEIGNIRNGNTPVDNAWAGLLTSASVSVPAVEDFHGGIEGHGVNVNVADSGSQLSLGPAVTTWSSSAQQPLSCFTEDFMRLALNNHKNGGNTTDVSSDTNDESGYSRGQETCSKCGAANKPVIARCQTCSIDLCEVCAVRHLEESASGRGATNHSLRYFNHIPVTSTIGLLSIPINGTNTSSAVQRQPSAIGSRSLTGSSPLFRGDMEPPPLISSRPSSTVGQEISAVLRQRYAQVSTASDLVSSSSSLPLALGLSHTVMSPQIAAQTNSIIAAMLQTSSVCGSGSSPALSTSFAGSVPVAGSSDPFPVSLSPFPGASSPFPGAISPFPAAPCPFPVAPSLRPLSCRPVGFEQRVLPQTATGGNRLCESPSNGLPYPPQRSNISDRLVPSPVEEIFRYCRIHVDQAAVNFCGSCGGAPVCELCIVHHTGHALHSPDSLAEITRSKCASLRESIDDMVSSLTLSSQSIRMTRCEIEIEIGKHRKKLEEEYTQALTAANQLFAETRRHLSNIERNKISALETQWRTNQVVIEHLKQCRRAVEGEMERGNQAGTFVAARSAATDMAELRKLVSLAPSEDARIALRLPKIPWLNLLRNEMFVVTTSYPPNCHIRAGLRMGYGRDTSVPCPCYFYICMRGHSGQPAVCDDADAIVVSILHPDGTTIVPKIDRLTDSYRVTYYLKDTGRYQVMIKVRGQHIRDSPYTFHFPRPRVVGVMGQGLLSKPWGTCINEDDTQLMIGDRNNHCVQILNADGILLNQVKGRPMDAAMGGLGSLSGSALGSGAGNKGFSRPTGVAIDRLNRLIITDKDNHRVQIYTLDGTFLTMFGRLGQRDTEFNYPWGVAVDSSNCLFIADSRNTRVVCYSPTQQFLRKTNFKKRITPRSIVCTPNDDLLVSDFEEHCVYIINSDLTMRTVVSSAIQLNPLNRPQCLALDADSLVYVVESKPKRFQVFSPNEEALCCVESDGAYGPMHEPSGICITRDGRIIIADSQNHRLLVFR